jgi:hypothetical protein
MVAGSIPAWSILLNIKSIAGPSKDKGKSKEQIETEEGKQEREWLVSLTVSKFKGAFHNGCSCFVYNWIDNNHGDSWLDQDAKESDSTSIPLIGECPGCWM